MVGRRTGSVSVSDFAMFQARVSIRIYRWRNFWEAYQRIWGHRLHGQTAFAPPALDRGIPGRTTACVTRRIFKGYIWQCGRKWSLGMARDLDYGVNCRPDGISHLREQVTAVSNGGKKYISIIRALIISLDLSFRLTISPLA